MKKRIAAIAPLLLLTTACSAVNTIQPAVLTEREQTLLTLGNTKSMVFDYETDDSYENVNLTLERYENGELIGEPKQFGGLSPTQGSVVLTVKEFPDHNEKEFIIAVLNEDSTSSATFLEDFSAFPADQTSSSWGNLLTESASINEEVLLGYINFHTDDTPLSGLPGDTSFDSPEFQDELDDQQLVFLLKATFSEE